MPARDIPARTWLLAAGAGWALTAWVLALAGMGRHAPPLPPTAAAGALPTVRAPAPSRLGPPTMYAAITTRPLLSEDRRPRPFVIAGQVQDQSTQPAFDLILTSVLLTPNMQMAILQSPDGTQSLRVKVGGSPDTQPGWRLSSLSARSAVFEGPEGQRTLELRVFDGQGGASPTPSSVAAMPPPPSQAMPGAIPLPAPNVPPSGGTPPATLGSSTKGAGTTLRTDPDAPTAMPEAAQIEAIRQRIEARRAQLRQQVPPGAATPAPTPAPVPAPVR